MAERCLRTSGLRIERVKYRLGEPIEGESRTGIYAVVSNRNGKVLRMTLFKAQADHLRAYNPSVRIHEATLALDPNPW